MSLFFLFTTGMTRQNGATSAAPAPAAAPQRTERTGRPERTERTERPAPDRSAASRAMDEFTEQPAAGK